MSLANSQMSTETITNIIFGIAALVIGIITVWQSYKVWSTWHHHRHEHQHGTVDLELADIAVPSGNRDEAVSNNGAVPIEHVDTPHDPTIRRDAILSVPSVPRLLDRPSTPRPGEPYPAASLAPPASASHSYTRHGRSLTQDVDDQPKFGFAITDGEIAAHGLHDIRSSGHLLGDGVNSSDRKMTQV